MAQTQDVLGTATVLYDAAAQLPGAYDAAGTPIYETIYLGGLPVGVMKQTGTAATSDIAVSLYNLHADHIATPRIITRQADQAIVWRWDTAEAFGGTAPEQDPSGLGAFVFNQRFPGQVFDAETGLFQNWNREYNARQGRYIQSDPIGLAGGINTYGYVGADPFRFTDPKGLFPGEIPQHESEIPFEPPQCKHDDCLCKCLEQYLGGETLVGTGVAVSGLPTVPKRFTTPGSSPGTSVASQTVSEVLGNRRLPGRAWAPTLANPGAMTTSAARFVGRWVSSVGWVIPGADGYQVYQCKAECEDEKCKK